MMSQLLGTDVAVLWSWLEEHEASDWDSVSSTSPAMPPPLTPPNSDSDISSPPASEAQESAPSPRNYSQSPWITQSAGSRDSQSSLEQRTDDSRNMQHPTGQGKTRQPRHNAARERTRVKTLRSAFLDLQRSLPSVPPDTKLSKLDVLVLAATYIRQLMDTLDEQGAAECDGAVVRAETVRLESLKQEDRGSTGMPEYFRPNKVSRGHPPTFLLHESMKCYCFIPS